MRCRRYEGGDRHVEAVLSALWFIYHLFLRQGLLFQVCTLLGAGCRWTVAVIRAQKVKWHHLATKGNPRETRSCSSLRSLGPFKLLPHFVLVSGPPNNAVIDTATLWASSGGLQLADCVERMIISFSEGIAGVCKQMLICEKKLNKSTSIYIKSIWSPTKVS